MSADPLRSRAATFFRALQDRITSALEEIDGSKFREDNWSREGGGGGRSRVLTEGRVFEKAGVGFSDVHGEFSEEFARQIPGTGRSFSACGVSLVFHPRSPMIPTVHANFRFITRGEKQWFGGGGDLTPYYPYREDVIHFHRVWRDVCTKHAPLIDYAHYKKWCDEYFFLPHRNEPRGVGGIFFDNLEAPDEATRERHFAFVQDAGNAFREAYLPLVRRRKDEPYTEEQRFFQEFRRGRYAEFNLIYDRGTIFGLKTGGRTESILMSLPPRVRWLYDYHPAPGTREAELYEVYLKPRDWANS
jgi:coproporphyrinogen III oxidase